ncbi:MAG: hypothetical protein ACI8ZM_004103 [Crocinitomix sp.]|jgi:hypothetical protein
MRILILFLFTMVFAILSCKKESIIVDEPSTWGYVNLSPYQGDWKLTSTHYYKKWWRKDSIEIYKTPELLLTLTDSGLPHIGDPSNPNTRFYYGKLFQDDEIIELSWNHRSINNLSLEDSLPDFFQNLTLHIRHSNLILSRIESSNHTDIVLQKSSIPFQQDSLIYRLAFSNALPNIGLMVGYINSTGDYTIDTLKSGNWEWEKKVLQTDDIRNYNLEIVGATDSFYEAIDLDYGVRIALQWSYAPINSNNQVIGLKDGVVARFRTDGTVEFDTSPKIKLLLKFID